jgi:hypothetical protein
LCCPSAQSSAQATPVSSRPPSKEHNRSSTSSDSTVKSCSSSGEGTDVKLLPRPVSAGLIDNLATLAAKRDRNQKLLHSAPLCSSNSKPTSSKWFAPVRQHGASEQVTKQGARLAKHPPPTHTHTPTHPTTHTQASRMCLATLWSVCSTTSMKAIACMKPLHMCAR